LRWRGAHGGGGEGRRGREKEREGMSFPPPHGMRTTWVPGSPDH